MRKKIWALTVAILLLFASIACAETGLYMGDWVLNAYEMNGMYLDASVFGLEMTLTLDPDGAVRLQFSDGSVSEGSWEFSGGQLLISADGESLDATVEDGTLIIDSGAEGTHMVFGRERVNSAFQPAAECTDVVLADFDGDWHAQSMGILGKLYPAETDMTLHIDNGKASVQLSDEAGAWSSYEAEGTLNGNELTIPAPNDSEESRELHLRLLEDGTLAHSEESGGMIIEIYFARN